MSIVIWLVLLYLAAWATVAAWSLFRDASHRLDADIDAVLSGSHGYDDQAEYREVER